MNRLKALILAVFMVFSAVIPTGEALAAAKEAPEQTTVYDSRIDQGLAMPVQSNSWENWPEGPAVSPHAAILMDQETGQVLYAKNITDAHYPASITKVMTGLLAVEHGDPDETVTFSKEAVFEIEPGSANAGMKPGEQISLDTALRVLFAWSANEVANGVAETIGGSIDDFVDMMNEKVTALGGVNTHFVNPHGLYNEEHYTCAYDMALIARAAYNNAWFRDFCCLPVYHRPLTEMNPEDDWTMVNRHQMFKESSNYYNPDVTGGKTGFTEEAHTTLVTFAEKDGLKLVCVVMYGEGAEVYKATQALFDYGFENFTHCSMQDVIDPTVVERINGDLTLTVPKGTDASAYVKTSMEKERWNRARLKFRMHKDVVASVPVTVTGEYLQRLSDTGEEVIGPKGDETDVSTEAAAQPHQAGGGQFPETVRHIAGAVWAYLIALPLYILLPIDALIVILVILLILKLRLNRMRNKAMDQAVQQRKDASDTAKEQLKELIGDAADE